MLMMNKIFTIFRLKSNVTNFIAEASFEINWSGFPLLHIAILSLSKIYFRVTYLSDTTLLGPEPH